MKRTSAAKRASDWLSANHMHSEILMDLAADLLREDRQRVRMERAILNMAKSPLGVGPKAWREILAIAQSLAKRRKS